MCSRYELNARARDLVDRFALVGAPPTLPTGSELRPTDRAPIVVAGGDGATLRLARWGLPASWDGKPLINARAETLAERRTFRPLLGQRCLVPATAYFEWRKDGRRRHRNRIAPVDGGLFAFAGLVDGDDFTIVTCAPAAAIAHVHDRMPVILAPAAEAGWLDPARPFAEAAPALAPYAASPLTAAEEAPRQPDLFA
jgi:putative SOS response-associated peptidase YedK